MTVARVRPGIASGRLRAPGSKSYTHRALVAGHLAHRTYRIDRPLRSEDTLATVGAVRALGSHVSLGQDRWIVSPPADDPRRATTIDCGESGTTLRFSCALAALGRRRVRLTGRGRLPIRPMRVLSEALRALGASVDPRSGRAGLPMTVQGPIHGGPLWIDASESSQFVSALLLALPTVRPDSTLRLEDDPVSAPYIEATLAVLSASGIRIDRAGRRFDIPGGQSYRGRGFVVPGDASSAAYLWAAAAISGGTAIVDGVSDAWPQADLAVLDLLEQFGARVQRRNDSVTVTGGDRRPIRVSLTGSPDLYPLAGVLAGSAPGRSRLGGAPHVVTKESDRRRATTDLARAMGARVRSHGSDLIIEGTASPRSLHVRGVRDHRVIMSAAVGALVADRPSTLSDADVVRKSFPEFWAYLGTLTGGDRIE